MYGVEDTETRPLRLTQARIDDTLYESNGSRIVVVNAFTSVNPETEQVVRTIN